MDQPQPKLTLAEIRRRAIMAAISRNYGSVPAAAKELAVSVKMIYNNLPRDAAGRILWDWEPETTLQDGAGRTQAVSADS